MGNSTSHVGGGPGERRKSGSSTPRDRHFSGNEALEALSLRAGANNHVIGPLDVTKSIPVSENSRNTGFRPRSTTESGPRRQISVDSPGGGRHKSGTQYVRKLPTIFKYNAKEAREVYVSGTFNGWKKMPMVKSSKDFVAIVELDQGDHEYKFLVDGQWINDTNSPVFTTENGNKYNRIHVQKEDFDAYDALDMDSAAVSKLQQKKKQQQFANEFGQEIPTPHVFEHRSGPPILPPHLLQVILNKDTPLSCEPTLLPEPNHVMINHLYALSIKDGVMVLSSTQRYRKKYVTTLLYKPMGSRKQE